MRVRLLEPRLASPGVDFSLAELRRVTAALLNDPDKALFLGAIVVLCALTYLVGAIVFSIPIGAETFPADCH
jgi:hypothetical protein